MAKRKQSELSKQKSRIKKIVKGAKSRGYTFTGGDIFQYLPSDAVQLKNVKPEQIYSLAIYVDESTGNVISGTARRAQERSNASRKGWITHRATAQDFMTLPNEIDEVIENAMDLLNRMQHEIEHWSSSEQVLRKENEWKAGKRSGSKNFYDVKEQDKNILTRLFESAINRVGKETVARNLQARAAEAQGYLEAILYGGSGAQRDGGNYAQAELTSFLSICLTGSADALAAADLVAIEPTLEANEEI
nr:MAG TPA: hypothetical protein [Caudoviricetes sp.]